MRNSTEMHGVALHRLAELGCAMLIVALAGCGLSSTSGAGAHQTTTATSAASEAPSSPSTSGQVMLTLSQTQYTTEDPLLVTIHNGLGQTIWFQGDRTTCAGLVVQRLTQGAWQAMGSCVLSRPAQPVALAVGASLVKRIDHAQGTDTGAGWPAGTYRVMFTYTLDQSASASAAQLVYSATFAIQ